MQQQNSLGSPSEQKNEMICMCNIKTSGYNTLNGNITISTATDVSLGSKSRNSQDTAIFNPKERGWSFFFDCPPRMATCGHPQQLSLQWGLLRANSLGVPLIGQHGGFTWD